MRSYSDQSESAFSDWSEYERTGKAFLVGLSRNECTGKAWERGYVVGNII